MKSGSHVAFAHLPLVRTMRALAIAVSVGAPALPVSAQAQLTTIYSFTGNPDGATPESGLTNVGGKLWGTTLNGGASNDGTAFAVDPTSYTETFSYGFTGNPDGARPNGDLIALAGTVYGTTYSGGSGNAGTVFAVKTDTGAETVIHSFSTQRPNDHGGFLPLAGLTYWNNALFGVTPYGGIDGAGVIFSIAPDTGAETVLHAFGEPTVASAPLLYSRGYLDGTGSRGGASHQGSFFKLKIDTRDFQTLWTFGNPPDGAIPTGKLTGVNGVVYGTTRQGGGTCAHGLGCGTVFGIAENGETFLYRFHLAHGAAPLGGVIYEQGKLYGTTSEGGASGDGTVFELDPATGIETVLVNFDGTNGAQPPGPLLCYQGNLYGTTASGGTSGAGTVFEYQPTTPLKC